MSTNTQLIFATTSLHVAWVIIVWAIAVMIVIPLVLLCFIVVGGIMITVGRIKKSRRAK